MGQTHDPHTQQLPKITRDAGVSVPYVSGGTAVSAVQCMMSVGQVIFWKSSGASPMSAAESASNPARRCGQPKEAMRMASRCPIRTGSEAPGKWNKNAHRTTAKAVTRNQTVVNAHPGT